MRRMIRFQGHLTNESNAVTSDSLVASLEFRLYALPSGGTALWTETHAEATINDGLFNVMLGSVTRFEDGVGLDLTPPGSGRVYFSTFENPLYLGMSIGGGAEQAPRWLITSPVFAFDALHAKIADRGQPLLPVARLKVTKTDASPADVINGVPLGQQPLRFDAAESYLPTTSFDPAEHALNPETYNLDREEIEFVFDFEGNGDWDKVGVTAPVASHSYAKPGIYHANVIVRRRGDTSGPFSIAHVLVRIIE